MRIGRNPYSKTNVLLHRFLCLIGKHVPTYFFDFVPRCYYCDKITEKSLPRRLCGFEPRRPLSMPAEKNTRKNPTTDRIARYKRHL